ncbi:MAG: cytochrome c3 family protein [Bryobacteraceae bacterium]|nr:cytochrome c3 family protein [Bryobacteraceae bacterium]
MRNAGIAVIWLAAAVAGGQDQPVYKSKEEELPQRVAPQPVPFSHKVHAEAGSACKDCHTTAATKERAGLPQADRCMLCHRTVKADSPAVQELAKYQREGKRIAWVRVYRVPEFVFFSHANHGKAGEACETCHGPVATRDEVAKEVSTTMTSCMNCHAAREVSNDCHFCHSLGY